MGHLSLKKQQEAVHFDSKLCRPIAEIVADHEDQISANAVYAFTGSVIEQLSYLDVSSGGVKGFLGLLQNIKNDLKKAVSAEELAKRFDPAIAFFRTQLASKKDVMFDCNDSKYSLGSESTFVPALDWHADSNGLAKQLKETFGLNITEPLEVWLNHRIAYTNIKPKAKNLVLVTTEIHDSKPLLADELELLDMLKANEGEYTLFLAQESSSKESNAFFETANSSDLLFQQLLRAKAKDGSARNLFDRFLGAKQTIDAITNQVVMENPKADESFIYRVVLGIAMGWMELVILGKDQSLFWPLDDEALKSRVKDECALSSCISLDECFKFYGDCASLQAERDKAMAKNLNEGLSRFGASKDKAIVLFTVGGFHASGLLKLLEKMSDTSVVVLMSRNYSDYMKVLLPQAK